jgi:DNA polymerase-4
MTPNVILHVDMDAFYAAVEVLEDPSLRGRPVVVGGTGRRGVVAACTYEARAYGIHSAMPSVQARRLCPHAVFLPGRHDVYGQYSRRVFDVFKTYTPLVEGISLDEAFLDVSGATRLFGDGPGIAATIRTRVHDEVGLWSSVGVATSKLMAKLASEAAKPTPSRSGAIPGAGVVVVPPGEELAFLHPRPVRSLWGVGPATFARLERFGVVTVGDLAAVPVDTLTTALGPSLGRHLHDLAWARDERRVEADRRPKSISHEETFARNHHDHVSLQKEIVRLSDGVASRLRSAGLAGRTVTIKVRFGDFRTITRSHSEGAPVETGPDIARIAGNLLANVDPAPGVRLLGVGVSQLAPPDRQLRLDEALPEQAEPDWPRASHAVDEVRRKFGDKALGPAALVGDGGLRVKRPGDTQWGPPGDG